MNIEAGLAIFAILLAAYGGIGILLGRWSITMPMVFVIIGVVLGPYGLGLIPIRPGDEAIRTLTELTLAQLLFADASTIDFGRLRHDAHLPSRLLWLRTTLDDCARCSSWRGCLFPAQGWGVCVLAGGRHSSPPRHSDCQFFTNPNVPVRIRRALNVESGLNDGIATPFVSLFIALAVAEEHSTPQGVWLVSALTQIVLADIVGRLSAWSAANFSNTLIGASGAYGAPLQFAVLALALTAYLGSGALGGNGFVAAFVAGIAFGAITRARLTESAEYTETTGTLLSLFVWTIFGAAFIVPAALSAFDWRAVGYAVLSLTLIRMLPVAVSLVGLRFRRDTVGLMG